MRICALIPAYNEAAHIAQVVEGARRHVDAVVVIDDGSTDSTSEKATEAGALCLHTAKNSGKGVALLTGLAHAQAGGFTHAVTIDGDGQHAPDDIPLLIEAAQRTNGDLVIGARAFDRDKVPMARYYSNTVGSRWASALAGQRILDSQSGFRLFRLEKLRGSASAAAATSLRWRRSSSCPAEARESNTRPSEPSTTMDRHAPR